MWKLYLRWISILLVSFFLCIQVTAQQTEFKQYKALLVKNAAKLGITTTDANDAVITNAYTDASTQLTYIYLQQAYQQVKVYNTIITATFRNGSLVYTSGSFVKDIAQKAGSITPAKTHLDAVRAAAQHLQLPITGNFSTVSEQFTTEKKYVVSPAGIAKRNIEVALFWTPSGDKHAVKLSWNVNIDVKDSADWWNVRIDAQTGEYLEKDNWTVNEHFPDNTINPVTGTLPLPVKSLSKKRSANDHSQIILQSPPPGVTSATYRVVPYPVESPQHGSFANVTDPWLLAGANNPATTLGWHYDNVTDYNITRGNNVFAFLDRRANNTPDPIDNWPDTSTTPIPSLTFIHHINTAEQPFKSTENKKVALDNLFYWNNIIHDITYQYGFTEPAGNFQRDNMGRGGAGNDFVSAQAQDSAGYNNANFATPVDGSSGRMQMYTWTTPPVFTIVSPSAIAGTYAALEPSLTAPNKLAFKGPITGKVIWYNDDAAGTVHSGCQPAVNAAAIIGNIALIDAFGNSSTGCNTYTYKIKNAQNAGAIAVIIYSSTNNLINFGGTDNSITIPVITVTNTTGNAIINQLAASQEVNVTMASGIYKDGDLDNGIIVHEYGHGISNRLTGGPSNSSCLTNAEQGGEGWSDYFGLMLTTDWTSASLTSGANSRGIGTYAYNQSAAGSGIRRYPYSTNMSVNPLTYANVATNTQVHAIGEIWCSALWDMTWNIIQQQGAITGNLYNSAGTGGNVIAMNLVMTGLKLQPCGPGYLDARNAILAADSILYNYAHKCAIWSAFARRGMGYSASQGLASSATDQTAAYDVPASIQVSKPMPFGLSAGVQKTFTHTATSDCQAVSGIVLRDTIPAGFTYVSSSPAGTLDGDVLSFPSTSFAAGETKTFSITLIAPSEGCIVDSVIYDNRESSTAGGLVSSGSPGWSVTGTKAYSPTLSWYAPDAGARTTSILTSGSTATTAQKPLSIFSFWHYFNTENNYDGGVVEYSTDGTTWNDAASLFIRGAYTAPMDAGSPLPGRRAFSGTNLTFTPVYLNLASLGTTPVSFRFRMESDEAVGGEGWFVDNIVRANGCGGILKTGVYNSSGARQDTLMQPIYVLPTGILPLSLMWFYANQVGSQVALDWRTVSEAGVKDFTVEWSTDGTNWTTLGSVAAQNRNSNSYNFLHSHPVNGNNFYRIKMNDADGRFTYSPVRIINLKEKGKPMLVLIPNPVSTDAVLYISKEVKAQMVKVYNAAGSLVRQLTIGAGTQQVTISTNNLPAGMYTIETTGNSRHITRMVVQH